MLQKLEQAIKLAEAYRRERARMAALSWSTLGRSTAGKTSCVIRSQSAPERWPSALTAACGLPLAATTKTGPKSWESAYRPGGAAPTASLAICCPRHPAQQSFIVPSKKGGVATVIGGKRVEPQKP